MSDRQSPMQQLCPMHRHSSPTPPLLSRSLPLLGHALEFARDRGQLFRRGHDSLGEVFSIRLGTKPAAALIGPELHTLFFKETDQRLNMALPHAFLKPIFGEIAFVADHATYLDQRPVLYAPFQREKMTRYLEVIDETVRKWVAKLPDQGRLELTATMTDLVKEVAGRAIMGDAFMASIGPKFWALYDTLGKALDPLLPPTWPFPKFIRRDRARAKMAAALRPILAERRAHPARYDDLLQDLIQTPKVSGTPATDEELLGLVIALLFAGHETTAGQASWTIIQLLQHPGYKTQLQQQLDERFPLGSRVDAKSLAMLPTLRWAIDETTRMHPSADIMIRVTEAPLEVGAYTIPAGWPVFLAAEVAQMLPDIFPEPERYDPLRFSPEACTHKAHKNAIIGFGGGVHKCPGMSFAQNEILAIVAHLLQQFELSLETPTTSTRRDLGANRPTATWVSYRRRIQPLAQPIAAETIAAATAAGCPHMAKYMAQQQAQPS
jgi:sterol 14alpha-demethylase